MKKFYTLDFINSEMNLQQFRLATALKLFPSPVVSNYSESYYSTLEEIKNSET